MFDFQINQIKPFVDSNQIQKGFFLWVFHADKIPPHIGCSIDGMYFSLKVGGKDTALKSAKVLQLIDSKKIPALLIKVDSEISLESLFQQYQCYDKVETEKNTCLSPIIDLFNCKSTVCKFSELLKYLTERSKIETVFGLNLPQGYSCLPTYSKEDIDIRLRKLENAKSKKNISSLG
jgi:hypothetical protein